MYNLQLTTREKFYKRGRPSAPLGPAQSSIPKQGSESGSWGTTLDENVAIAEVSAVDKLTKASFWLGEGDSERLLPADEGASHFPSTYSFSPLASSFARRIALPANRPRASIVPHAGVIQSSYSVLPNVTWIRVSSR